MTSVTPFAVPIACGGGKEGLTSAIEALHLLESISVAVFNRLSTVISEQHDKLTNLDTRTSQAAGIVSQVRGRTTATTVITPAQLPVTQEETIAPLSEWFNVEGLVNHQKRRYCEFRACADEDISERHANENFACAAVNNPMERPHEVLDDILAPRKKRMMAHKDGLGRLPEKFDTVSSLLVFDSFTNPYKVDDASIYARNSVGMKKRQGLNSVDIPQLEVADEVMMGITEEGDDVSGNRLGYTFTPQPVPMSEWALPKSVPGLSNVADLPWEFDEGENNAWAPIAPAYGRAGGKVVQSGRSAINTEVNPIPQPPLHSVPPLPPLGAPVLPPPLPLAYQSLPSMPVPPVIPPPLPLPQTVQPGPVLRNPAAMPTSIAPSSPPPIPPTPPPQFLRAPNVPPVPIPAPPVNAARDILSVPPPLPTTIQPTAPIVRVPPVSVDSPVAPNVPNLLSPSQSIENTNRATGNCLVIQGGPPTPSPIQAPRPPANLGLFAEINALANGGAMRVLRDVRLQRRQEREEKEKHEDTTPIMRVLQVRRGQLEQEGSEDESENRPIPPRRRVPPPPPPRPAAPTAPVVMRPRRADDFEDE